LPVIFAPQVLGLPKEFNQYGQNRVNSDSNRNVGSFNNHRRTLDMNLIKTIEASRREKEMLEIVIGISRTTANPHGRSLD
jgi:hypothetical protein